MTHLAVDIPVPTCAARPRRRLRLGRIRTPTWVALGCLVAAGRDGSVELSVNGDAVARAHGLPGSDRRIVLYGRTHTGACSVVGRAP